VSGWEQGGYAFYLTEYPEEGLVGPFRTREEAEEAPSQILPDDDTSVCELDPEQCRILEAS
jgi:hypothetical protein